MKRSYYRLVRLLLADQRAVQLELYAEGYTRKERVNMSKLLTQTMWAEVGMLRTAIKRYFSATSAHSDAEKPDPQLLAYDLRMLGSACMRLARVMQVNYGLMESLNKRDDGALSEVMDSLLAEMWRDDRNVALEVSDGG